MFLVNHYYRYIYKVDRGAKYVHSKALKYSDTLKFYEEQVQVLRVKSEKYVNHKYMAPLVTLSTTIRLKQIIQARREVNYTAKTLSHDDLHLSTFESTCTLLK